MKRITKTLLLSFLMIVLGLSAATSGMNEVAESSQLPELGEASNVILPASQLNEPGFQEGSIFTDTTLSSGGSCQNAIAMSGIFSCHNSVTSHTCAILDNGSVSCWGWGSSGQLGYGGNFNKNTPTLTSDLGIGRTAVAIASGDGHTCVILDNGDVSCWGWGFYGQLGNGGTSNKNSPTPTSSLGTGRTAIALSSGDFHTCAILDNGDVSCWGRGYYGQLGNGGTSNKNSPTPTSSLGAGRTAVALSSGNEYTCAILDNGEVSCWGEGYYGQLGNGVTTETTPTLTSSLGTGRTAVAIASGGAHTCVILDSGEVSCWGLGTFGQLGNGATSNKTTPTLTSSLGTGRTAVAISSGGAHTCVILDNGDVSCWGFGTNGRLGNGGTSDKTTPTLTSSLGTGRTAVAISSGGAHTCVILDNGEVSCWGYGNAGQLGDGGTSDNTTPTLTSSLGTGRTTALSERDFNGNGVLNILEQKILDVTGKSIAGGASLQCVILDNGKVSCWGWGVYGQVGNGGTSSKSSPTLTSSLGSGRTAIAVSTGYAHACAILDNGLVSCWGQGNSGQLGNGGTSSKSSPTLTSSLGSGRTAIAISSGYQHTCALLDNGTVSCWGEGSDGRLGNGNEQDSLNPWPVSSFGTGRTAVAISVGSFHSCAILDNGDVSCWGKGSDGQLGNGGTSMKTLPTLTSSFGTGRTPVAISSSSYYNCVILDNEAVSCWGQLSYALPQRNSPTSPGSFGTGLTAKVIAVGSEHACAILDNGLVSCWGENSHAQLGNGGTSRKSTPTSTSSLGTGRTAIAISTGYQHTCAVLDDGNVSCWGRSNSGQLGNGGTSTKSTPTLTNSLGVGRTPLFIDADADGDGAFDHTEAFPGNPIRSIACNAGQYGRYVCVDAMLGKYVPSSGSMYANDASAGYYVDQTGQSTQSAADAGYYVDSTLGVGQTSQTACLAGTYNPNTGSTSSSACGGADAGYYVDPTLGVGQTSQTACLAGTYNPNTGSTSSSACGDADAGYYVPTPGQSSQTACLAGTYNPNTGSIRSVDCLESIVGYYVPTSGQSSQTACAAGTYQAATAQSSCDDADLGYYVPATGQSTQTECVIGTYQTLAGQSSCDEADAGYYVDQIGQSSQSACAAGTYQEDTGQDGCDDAEPGFYVDQTGQTDQTRCEVGTYQASTAQSSCDDADAGYYVDRTGQTDQLECDYGMYQVDTGQDDCDDADAGYYVDQMGQSSQTQCPTGYTTITIRSTSGNQCLSDYDGDTIVDALDSDTDGDGVLDLMDQCLTSDFHLSADNDSDGCDDADEDTDDDNDGILDVNDQLPLDPTENEDTDGDGTGDNVDTDDDDDSVLDVDDAFPLDSTESVDTDDDGTGDNEDTDDDNDQVLDADDAFPLDSTESVDTDDDGTGDNTDMDDDGDGVYDLLDAFPLDSTESVDTDNDETGDSADTDDDDDSVLDADDAFPLDSTESVDTDNDGTGDNADTDDDGDGVSDTNDAFPLDSAESVDTDDDGTGDNADTDDDNDSVVDADDAFPLDSTESVDTDNDGTGDNTDADDDGDRVPDAEDAFSLDATESIDTDGDGTGDNTDLDDDGDNVADIDDDLPFDATESVDTDHDGIGNNADTDDDGDGVSDSSDDFPEDSTEWEDANGDGRGDNNDPLSSFENAQQEPALPILGFGVVIAFMVMLYRAQPPLKQEKKSFVDISEEE